MSLEPFAWANLALLSYNFGRITNRFKVLSAWGFPPLNVQCLPDQHKPWPANRTDWQNWQSNRRFHHRSANDLSSNFGALIFPYHHRFRDHYSTCLIVLWLHLRFQRRPLRDLLKILWLISDDPTIIQPIPKSLQSFGDLQTVAQTPEPGPQNFNFPKLLAEIKTASFLELIFRGQNWCLPTAKWCFAFC